MISLTRGKQSGNKYIELVKRSCFWRTKRLNSAPGIEAKDANAARRRKASPPTSSQMSDPASGWPHRPNSWVLVVGGCNSRSINSSYWMVCFSCFMISHPCCQGAASFTAIGNPGNSGIKNKPWCQNDPLDKQQLCRDHLFWEGEGFHGVKTSWALKFTLHESSWTFACQFELSLAFSAQANEKSRQLDVSPYHTASQRHLAPSVCA